LDHADQALSAQRIVDHRKIARLENIERQRPSRQQQSPRQREDGNRLRQFGGALIDAIEFHRERFYGADRPVACCN
jgi:hypothetical protein